jgi:hypothetical protein
MIGGVADYISSPLGPQMLGPRAQQAQIDAALAAVLDPVVQNGRAEKDDPGHAHDGLAICNYSITFEQLRRQR